jgi:hypothetical protein
MTDKSSDILIELKIKMEPPFLGPSLRAKRS